MSSLDPTRMIGGKAIFPLLSSYEKVDIDVNQYSTFSEIKGKQYRIFFISSGNARKQAIVFRFQNCLMSSKSWRLFQTGSNTYFSCSYIFDVASQSDEEEVDA